jgi:hypothetical protein
MNRLTARRAVDPRENRKKSSLAKAGDAETLYMLRWYGHGEKIGGAARILHRCNSGAVRNLLREAAVHWWFEGNIVS